MKIKINFIMFCLSFLVITYGCERTDLQKSSLIDSAKIEPREIEECDECPLNDCCCAVWLQFPTSTSAQLFFCGTSDGNQLCTGVETGNCDAFSGGGQQLNLDQFTPRRGFCVDPGQAFWIHNTGTGDADIYVTCQYDEVSPQTLTLTIPEDGRVYIGSSGECIIFECE